MSRTAKGPVSSIGQEPQEEMTVVILRLKGGGETLKKGFDALTTAFNSLGAPPQLMRQVNGALPKQLGGPAAPALEEEIDEHAGEPNEIEVASVRAGRANSDGGLSGGSVRPQPKMAGMRRADEQTSASEPHSGLQGEGGLGRHQGRKNTFGIGAVV